MNRTNTLSQLVWLIVSFWQNSRARHTSELRKHFFLLKSSSSHELFKKSVLIKNVPTLEICNIVLPAAVKCQAVTAKMKKRSDEMQTLCAGCSKVEPKIFAPPQTSSRAARDSQNLISWRWSLPSPTKPVWWGSMHAISSYRGNRPTNKQTDRGDYNTLATASVQCQHSTWCRDNQNKHTRTTSHTNNKYNLRIWSVIKRRPFVVDISCSENEILFCICPCCHLCYILIHLQW